MQLIVAVVDCHKLVQLHFAVLATPGKTLVLVDSSLAVGWTANSDVVAVVAFVFVSVVPSSAPSETW